MDDNQYVVWPMPKVQVGIAATLRTQRPADCRVTHRTIGRKVSRVSGRFRSLRVLALDLSCRRPREVSFDTESRRSRDRA